MTKNILINYSQDYDRISIVFTPDSFRNNNITTFEFTINSPDGYLLGYGYNLTAVSKSYANTGSSAIGGFLSSAVNVSGASIGDTVRVDYYYISSIDGRRNFTTYLTIYQTTSTTGSTFMANKDNTYGLGVFERLLISTLFAILVLGVSALVGQLIMGFGLTLFVFAYMVR